MKPIRDFCDDLEDKFHAASKLRNAGYPNYVMKGHYPQRPRFWNDAVKWGQEVFPRDFTWVGNTLFFTTVEQLNHFIIEFAHKTKPAINRLPARFGLLVNPKIEDKGPVRVKISQTIGRRIVKLKNDEWFFTNSEEEIVTLKLTLSNQGHFIIDFAEKSSVE
jgi:hypothetical protein